VAVSEETFDMGRVFTRMATTIVDHWMVVIGFAAVASVVMAIANSLAMGALAGAGASSDPTAALAIFTSSSYWLSILISTVVGSFCQAGLLAALYQGETEGSVSFEKCVSGAASRFIPYFFLTIIWAIAVTFGLILLVAPGVFLIIVWSVSAPALAGEGRSLFDAFARSQELTHGNRLWIFLTLIIFLLLYLFVSFAAQGFSITGMAELYQSNIIAAMIVGAIAYLVQITILMSFLNALYFELRLVKEGSGTSELKDIFA
jgi:hypothetical protein